MYIFLKILAIFKLYRLYFIIHQQKNSIQNRKNYQFLTFNHHFTIFNFILI